MQEYDVYPMMKDPLIYILKGYNFESFEQYKETKRQEIVTYRGIWDSDDNDTELQKSSVIF